MLNPVEVAYTLGGVVDALLQDIHVSQGPIGSVFTLEDDGAEVQDFDGVPLAGGDVEAVGGAVRGEVEGVGDDAVEVVIEDFAKVAAKADDGLGGFLMAMDGQDSAWLHGIEHALRLIVRRGPEVIVHAETGRGLGLDCKVIKQEVVYCDHWCFVYFPWAVTDKPNVSIRQKTRSVLRGKMMKERAYSFTQRKKDINLIIRYECFR